MKRDYVDTGKVRFSLREFPGDGLALGGFIVARKAADRNEMLDALFDGYDEWVKVDGAKRVEAVKSIAARHGMNKEAVEAAFSDKELGEKIIAVGKFGIEKLKVKATPTFFINGVARMGGFGPDKLSVYLGPA
jgi:protein-disulfide isomerase